MTNFDPCVEVMTWFCWIWGLVCHQSHNIYKNNTKLQQKLSNRHMPCSLGVICNITTITKCPHTRAWASSFIHMTTSSLLPFSAITLPGKDMSVWGYERAIYLSCTVLITNAELPEVDPGDLPGDSLFSVGLVSPSVPEKADYVATWSLWPVSLKCHKCFWIGVCCSVRGTTLSTDKMRHSWPKVVPSITHCLFTIVWVKTWVFCWSFWWPQPTLPPLYFLTFTLLFTCYRKGYINFYTWSQEKVDILGYFLICFHKEHEKQIHIQYQI